MIAVHSLIYPTGKRQGREDRDRAGREEEGRAGRKEAGKGRVGNVEKLREMQEKADTEK